MLIKDQKLSADVRVQLTRELYKKSYYEFFCDAVRIIEPQTEWDFNFHHKYLCDLLEKEARRIAKHKPKTSDFNINIPPRSSKSLICSVVFNAWVWACVSPHLNFMYISHTESLALNLAQKTKQLIESHWYRNLFPDITINSDVSAKGYYQNNYGGIRMSFGAFGGITGEGADFIVIDDIIKPQDASGVLLANSINTFKETIYNRLNNPKVGVRLIIGQRVAEGDLSGFILSSEDKTYSNICLPVELTEDVSPVELVGKYKDGLLWPKRFDWDVITDIRKPTGVGESGYATQYLQRPAPVAGGLIKRDWLDIVDSTPSGIDWHLFIDTAQTSKLKNDPSAILVAGTVGNIVYIKQALEYWLEFPQLIEKIRSVVQSEGTYKSKVYIEPKSVGQAVAQTLRRETLLNIIEMKAPTDSKQKRVESITPALQSGRVKLVRGSTGHWIENFIHQITTFPASKHDDLVDVLVYAVDQLLNKNNTIKWYM